MFNQIFYNFSIFFITFSTLTVILHTFSDHHENKPSIPNLTTIQEHPPNFRLLSGSDDHVSGGNLVVLYVSSSIFIGAFLRELHKKLHIPYAAMLVLIGLALGYWSTYLYIFGEAVDLVNKMNPLALLMIFIPGLVFNSSYNIDGYIA